MTKNDSTKTKKRIYLSEQDAYTLMYRLNSWFVPYDDIVCDMSKNYIEVNGGFERKTKRAK